MRLLLILFAVLLIVSPQIALALAPPTDYVPLYEFENRDIHQGVWLNSPNNPGGALYFLYDTTNNYYTLDVPRDGSPLDDVYGYGNYATYSDIASYYYYVIDLYRGGLISGANEFSGFDEMTQQIIEIQTSQGAMPGGLAPRFSGQSVYVDQQRGLAYVVHGYVPWMVCVDLTLSREWVVVFATLDITSLPQGVFPTDWGVCPIENAVLLIDNIEFNVSGAWLDVRSQASGVSVSMPTNYLFSIDYDISGSTYSLRFDLTSTDNLEARGVKFLVAGASQGRISLDLESAAVDTIVVGSTVYRPSGQQTTSQLTAAADTPIRIYTSPSLGSGRAATIFYFDGPSSTTVTLVDGGASALLGVSGSFFKSMTISFDNVNYQLYLVGSLAPAWDPIADGVEFTYIFPNTLGSPFSAGLPSLGPPFDAPLGLWNLVGYSGSSSLVQVFNTLYAGVSSVGIQNVSTVMLAELGLLGLRLYRIGLIQSLTSIESIASELMARQITDQQSPAYGGFLLARGSSYATPISTAISVIFLRELLRVTNDYTYFAPIEIASGYVKADDSGNLYYVWKDTSQTGEDPAQYTVYLDWEPTWRIALLALARAYSYIGDGIQLTLQNMLGQRMAGYLVFPTHAGSLEHSLLDSTLAVKSLLESGLAMSTVYKAGLIASPAWVSLIATREAGVASDPNTGQVIYYVAYDYYFDQPRDGWMIVANEYAVDSVLVNDTPVPLLGTGGATQLSGASLAITENGYIRGQKYLAVQFLGATKVSIIVKIVGQPPSFEPILPTYTPDAPDAKPTPKPYDIPLPPWLYEYRGELAVLAALTLMLLPPPSLVPAVGVAAIGMVASLAYAGWLNLPEAVIATLLVMAVAGLITRRHAG